MISPRTPKSLQHAFERGGVLLNGFGRELLAVAGLGRGEQRERGQARSRPCPSCSGFGAAALICLRGLISIFSSSSSASSSSISASALLGLIGGGVANRAQRAAPRGETADGSRCSGTTRGRRRHGSIYHRYSAMTAGSSIEPRLEAVEQVIEPAERDEAAAFPRARRPLPLRRGSAFAFLAAFLLRGLADEGLFDLLFVLAMQAVSRPRARAPRRPRCRPACR